MDARDPYEALRFAEFKFFLLTRFALVFAWSMQFVVVEWLVYGITKDPLSLGLIGLAEVVPALCTALFAGHFVDQNEKRGLLLNCILGFCVLSMFLFILTLPQVACMLSTQLTLSLLYSLVFAGGFIRAFLGPTLFSLMALIVPKKTYANASTWSSSVWQMATVLGPALAGLTISWLGINGAMSIIFIFALLALLFIQRVGKKPILNQKKGEAMMQSLREGLLFVYRNKIVLGALSLDMFAVLFGGAMALLPVFAQDILAVGPEGFGVLRAMPAIGALVTMLFSAYFPVDKHAGKRLLAAIFAFGLCIIAFGLSTSFWISAVVLMLSGMADGISMVVRQTILQLKTPDEMRGRVASVNSMFVGSSNELGAFESGLTARLMGTVPAVVFGGAMTLLTVLLTAIFIPTLRKLDLRPDAHH